jgi:hypothetical protein
MVLSDIFQGVGTSYQTTKHRMKFISRESPDEVYQSGIGGGAKIVDQSVINGFL